MSLIFVELWVERPAWRSLCAAERADFVMRAQAAVREAAGDAVTLLAAADLDPGAQPYRHLAVWRAADATAVDAFRRALSSVGWYERFAQLDLAGPERSLLDILAAHAAETGDRAADHSSGEETA